MEVWAAGVTYKRSRTARAEESTIADVYDRVYDAERPELFFKSVPWRVVIGGEPIGVRADSPINVPEPELAVVVNASAEIVGYTICNDVSSRSIEGENPLYLPQAKVYEGGVRGGGDHPAGLGGRRPVRPRDRGRGRAGGSDRLGGHELARPSSIGGCPTSSPTRSGAWRSRTGWCCRPGRRSSRS